ncbi:oxidoreductase [Oenococcus sp.]|uniref:oxidoreductase n=1 Tax=Oenococcus sp. TaxID=1979414 RepID=UPI0039E7D7A2
MSNWLITGCSSGLGYNLALSALKAGNNVTVTARHTEKIQEIVNQYPDHAIALALDVTDPEQIKSAVAASKDRFGAIDVLVNNAGHGYRAAVEEGGTADVDELFETNFFGPVRLIKAVLPDMRSKKQGAIVNISSIAAKNSLAGSGYYAATKNALEAMSKSLRREVSPLGIKVMVVEPGAFRTDFAGRSIKESAAVIDDYAQTAGLRRKDNDHSSGTQPGDPKKAGDLLVEAVQSDHTPDMLLLGSDAIKVVNHELQADINGLKAWEDKSKETDF